MSQLTETVIASLICFQKKQVCWNGI